MATRGTDLKVTIDADAAKLERAIQSAGRSMQRFETQIRQTDVAAAQLDQMLDKQRADATRALGQGMLAFGAATVAGLGMAVNAAIDWESAWTGVEKVLEGTPQQFERLEKSLRELARVGFAHEEVAGVAAAAGQLGVATDDVAEFTRVMLDMGVSTNMSAEEASFAIARMANIMGTSMGDVQRLGSVIVDLGNNSATTERDIMEMGLRISGAGNTIGLTEAEVLSFAAALSSVGIESQAGGTAISRVMSNIASAVAEGGDSVQGFADVAGMSAEQFARAFQEDPAAAIASFVSGLGEINEAGGNVFGTLSDLGMGEIRVRDALLRMSGAGDLLTDSLDRGSQAWDENTALIEEAGRRYDTAEVKIQAAKSTLIDLAIDIGAVLLPAFVAILEKGTELVAWFADLPEPVQAVMTVLGLLAGAVALAGGAFLMMGPKIAAARVNIAHFATTNKVATGAALMLGSAVAKLSVAAAGFFIATQSLDALGFSAVNAAKGVDSASQSIAFRLAEVATGISGGFTVGVNEATEALLNLTDGMAVDIAEGTGIEDTFLRVLSRAREMDEVSEEAQAQLGAFDAALAHLATSGSAGQADEALSAIQEALQLTDGEMRELIEKVFPQYRDSLAKNRIDEREAVDAIVEVDEALLDLAIRFGLTGDDAEAAAQKMLDEWSKASGQFISLAGAYGDALAGLEEAERGRAQAAADATEDATDSWEDFYNDVSVTIDDFITKLDEQIEAQANWHANMAYLATRVSADMFAELARLGPEGAPLVQALVDGGEEKLKEADEKWQNATSTATTGITGELAKARPELERIALAHGQAVADEIAVGMVENGTTVKQEAENLGIEIDKGVGRDEVRDIPVQVTGHSEAYERIKEIRDLLSSYPKTISVAIDAQGNVRTQVPGGPQLALAMGGPVNGPGTATSDSIALWGSDGEYMMRAEARRKYGDKAMAAINAGIADVYVPGMGGQGGRLSNVSVAYDTSKLNVSAYRGARDAMLNGAASQVSGASGKVLPPGSYRIGRGPAGHGYNARDLPAPTGTPIFAAAAGIVAGAARLTRSYGIHARLQHAGFRTLYAHMSQMYVRAGQQVARGQMIGRVGSTGNSTGPHLHLEPDLPRLYDNGGFLRPGLTLAKNATGGLERVLNRAETDAVGGRDLPDSLKELRNASRDMAKFAELLRRLQKRGLSQSMLQALESAGPDRGLEQARAVFRGGSAGISQANAWQRRQDRAERSIERQFAEPDSGTPKAVFKDIAKAAGSSFVKGVIGSRDDIKRSFAPLFDAIGKVQEKATRQRLISLAKGAQRELLTLGRQWERVTDRLDRAREKLQQLKDSARQLRESVRDRIVGAADVTQAMIERRMSDRHGGYIKEDRSIKAITETLRAERDQARKFADAVEKLRKRGLNDTTLQQIVAAGPEDGLRTAEEILKGGRSGIDEINTLTKQLSNAGNRLGQSAADSMYKAGIQTAEGLIKGLEKEEKRIERLMARIADTMVNRIKKQLKIKSPSQVFAEEVGAPIGQGIAAGMLSAEDQVLAATRDIIDGAASQLPRWAGVEFSTPRAFFQTGGPGAVPHGSGGGDSTTWHIHGRSDEIIHEINTKQAYDRYRKARF